MSELPRYVVTLVHGTLLSGGQVGRGHWTMPSSPLRDLLDLKIPGIQFEVFSWSGRNAHKDRIAAADSLKLQLRGQVQSFPDAVHVIIAHSHGGNVALFALRDIELQAR